jgi:signal transduction histidine kinase
LTLQVDTLRNRLNLTDEPGLLELRDGVQSTVVDVRRIVEGLRPPALDELGLAGALEQLAGRLGDAGTPAIEICVSSGELPAAVEVAAYRIVQEALTNAVRHAQADHVSVSVVAMPECLAVTVADDGVGIVVPRAGGVGLGSMRERADEIGGSVRYDARSGTGTTVVARLPLSGPTGQEVHQ